MKLSALLSGFPGLPVACLAAFLMGASGCGGTEFGVSGGDAGAGGEDASVEADTGTVCTPASCAGLAAPNLAERCSDGTTLTASVCEDQGAGRCGWGFPPCPTDACPVATGIACPACPYGSVGNGHDANGCATCPICAPPPDSGGAVDACPPPPLCLLPNCPYGVVPQKDANGCQGCPVCAPPPDAGACQCGAPPPIAACPGAGSRSLTCERASSGSCSWVVGSCPNTRDAGGSCTSDAQCPGTDVCGFLETASCGIEGTCFAAPQVVCAAFSPGCACDGTVVNVICNGLPSGYARKPLKHTGACVDGG
jgi:hypothetical protein